MEMMIQFISSKLFIGFVILVIVYNMVRRYNKRIQRRSTRARHRLRDHIRDRQEDLWDKDDVDRSKD